MRRLLLRRCPAALVLCVMALDATACKFKPRAWEDLVAEATVVFEGTVKASANDRSGRKPDHPAVFRVEKVLKGNVSAGDTVNVWTSNSSCGLAFTKGQRWLVLSSGDPLQSHAPSGSLLLVTEQGGLDKENLRAAAEDLPRMLQGGGHK